MARCICGNGSGSSRCTQQRRAVLVVSRLEQDGTLEKRRAQDGATVARRRWRVRAGAHNAQQATQQLAGGSFIFCCLPHSAAPTNRSPRPLLQIDRPLAVQPVVAAVKVRGARSIFICVRLIFFDIPLSIFYYIQHNPLSIFNIRFYSPIFVTDSIFGFIRCSVLFDI